MSLKKQRSDPEKKIWCEPKVNIRLDLRDVDLIAHVKLVNDDHGIISCLVMENCGEIRSSVRVRSVEQYDQLIRAAKQGRMELLEHQHERELEPMKPVVRKVETWDGEERREPKERRHKEREERERRKPGWLAKLLDRE